MWWSAWGKELNNDRIDHSSSTIEGVGGVPQQICEFGLSTWAQKFLDWGE